VTWKRDALYGPEVGWYLDGKPIDRYPNGELWHVPAYPIPGTPIGLSPLSYAAQTVGLGIATRRFGAQWFGDGAHPTAYLENDQPLAQIQDAAAVKQRVMDAMAGNREPLALGGGWKLNTIQVAPEESQFLETIAANADDVARFFFRRPPGEGGQVTYANVEARSLDLLTYTISGWLIRLERAMTRLRPRGRYIKFNAAAMLRTDTETRYKAHTEAIRGGWATPNERRRLEDLEPLPEADELVWPPYTTTAATDPNTPDDPAMGGAPDEAP
jgi:HK97 family phage portal protein